LPHHGTTITTYIIPPSQTTPAPLTTHSFNHPQQPTSAAPNPQYLKKGKDVQVLYDGKWWGGKILLVHRGKSKGYKIKYYDDKGCEQSNVPAENIRELVDVDC